MDLAHVLMVRSAAVPATRDMAAARVQAFAVATTPSAVLGAGDAMPSKEHANLLVLQNTY